MDFEKRVYVLIKTYNDINIIIGVFKTLKILRDYVAINHAEFTLDNDGDYYYKYENDDFPDFVYPTPDYVYLSIHEEKIITEYPKVRKKYV